VTPSASAVLTGALLVGDVLLVIAAKTIDRKPFRALDRTLTDIWQGIYRATGAQALDRRLARRAGRRDMAMFADLAERLEGAGLAASANRCRAAAANAAARAGD